jgi:hypothetical protein
MATKDKNLPVLKKRVHEIRTVFETLCHEERKIKKHPNQTDLPAHTLCQNTSAAYTKAEKT